MKSSGISSQNYHQIRFLNNSVIAANQIVSFLAYYIQGGWGVGVGGGGGGGGGGREPTSQIRMKKSILSYIEKHPFKSVSCCRFPFRCSDKNQDRLRECGKKQGIILANLILNRIVIVENTRAQFT